MMFRNHYQCPLCQQERGLRGALQHEGIEITDEPAHVDGDHPRTTPASADLWA
jgi:hypothetical protein